MTAGMVTNLTPHVTNLTPGSPSPAHGLTPPPQDAYSLHRKLSGSFLACMRIGARVPAREMLREAFEKYKFGPVVEQEEMAAAVAA
jgi:aarF domain-containing kinase